MSKPTPTARTIARLRSEGYLADVVERFVRLPAGRSYRKDLFGFIDVLAISPDGSLVAIQCTSGSNVAARATKARLCIEASPQLRLCGWRVVVHGWRKLASGRWELREVEL